METPNLQPCLTGHLVTLKPMRANDWLEMFKAASNPRTWADHVKHDRYKEEVFRRYFEDSLSSESALTIFDSNTNKIIGTSRYHEYKSEISEIEIGWTFLDCAYWGGKYNAEVKRLMLQHAFSFLDVVVFWVAKENLRSQAAMRKIGGKLRDGEYSKTDNGKQFPYVVFEIRKDDFSAGPLNGQLSG